MVVGNITQNEINANDDGKDVPDGPPWVSLFEFSSKMNLQNDIASLG